MEEVQRNLVDIETLLKTVVFNKASDLHLVSRSAPQIRIDGTLRPLAMDPLKGTDIEYICYALKKVRSRKIKSLTLRSSFLISDASVATTTTL